MPYTANSDPYVGWRSDFTRTLSSTPNNAVPITPADGSDLARYVHALSCLGAGNVSVVFKDQPNETAVILYLNPGMWLPAMVRKVNATGTTATGIVGATIP